MEKLDTIKDRLGQFLSFLEQRAEEVHVIPLPPPPEGRTYPLAYHLNQAQEAAYRRAEQEFRRLFPEIDFYGGIKELEEK